MVTAPTYKKKEASGNSQTDVFFAESMPAFSPEEQYCGMKHSINLVHCCRPAYGDGSAVFTLPIDDNRKELTDRLRVARDAFFETEVEVLSVLPTVRKSFFWDKRGVNYKIISQWL